ncbi:hypothetical protein ABH931_007622 [Streptacidiphilus sp. MAP12-33]|uniref:hypothetical protein n=1 Tax=Streptacidiphilus sp. MAP12-33 TaxID=3156266 RepID=UPI003511EA4D
MGVESQGGAGRRGRAVLWGGVATWIVVAGGVLVGWVGPAAWSAVQEFRDGPDAGEPSCSWTAHIEKADADQAALVRCYLRALADHSEDELRAVVPSQGNGGPSGFTAADFAHTRDANSGTATVTVDADNEVDSADASVEIRYANGVTQTLEIHLANPMSLHSWRVWNLGTYPNDPNVPTTAAAPAP